MPIYNAPLADMKFILNDVFNAEQFWQSNENLAHVDSATAEAILEEMAKFSQNVTLPINRTGDEEGATFSNGAVTTPAGFKEAFKQYAEGGWIGLGADEEWGGQGMPKMLTVLSDEMLFATNPSFMLYPLLSVGAGMALNSYASQEQKETYLPKMYTGEWSGTMCLTEPHAGTDLGIIRTKAISQNDGSYAISGSKMFITGGEHDLTENIVHLVLAKLPDAPAGPRGISLFLVPKFNVNDDGTLGELNNVSCGSIEHKMGINASATCVMNFDGAKGYLIGDLNKGLSCMFTMMNFERIGVGIQGLSTSVRSYQNALEYAKDRIQGRALTGAKQPNKEADSILVHGDVRRMLLNMKALNEGSRALSSYIAMQLDYATYGTGELQTKGETLAALMTPVAKAFFTDLGFENTVAGQQVLGGHGYIREWGQEQLVRDARITQIYEGTNGIQAMDLLVRKVAASKGAMLNVFTDEVNEYIAQPHDENMQEFITPLIDALEDLTQLTTDLLNKSEDNINELGASANDYMHVFGYTAMAYIWARMIETAFEKVELGDRFYQSKIHTGRYYFTRLLPRRLSLIASAMSGSDCMFDIDDDLF